MHVAAEIDLRSEQQSIRFYLNGVDQLARIVMLPRGASFQFAVRASEKGTVVHVSSFGTTENPAPQPGHRYEDTEW